MDEFDPDFEVDLQAFLAQVGPGVRDPEEDCREADNSDLQHGTSLEVPEDPTALDQQHSGTHFDGAEHGGEGFGTVPVDIGVQTEPLPVCYMVWMPCAFTPLHGADGAHDVLHEPCDEPPAEPHDEGGDDPL